jgi:ketosteroid isomerase-like protein
VIASAYPKEGSVVLIATAIGAAFKFFGRNRKDADDDAQGDHPIVRRFFSAVNTGDYSEFAGVIHEDCEAYANGYRLAAASVDHGPDLIVATLSSMSEELPDWKAQLFDEVSGKDDGVEARYPFRVECDHRRKAP